MFGLEVIGHCLRLRALVEGELDARGGAEVEAAGKGLEIGEAGRRDRGDAAVVEVQKLGTELQLDRELYDVFAAIDREFAQGQAGAYHRGSGTSFALTLPVTLGVLQIMIAVLLVTGAAVGAAMASMPMSFASW